MVSDERCEKRVLVKTMERPLNLVPSTPEWASASLTLHQEKQNGFSASFIFLPEIVERLYKLIKSSLLAVPGHHCLVLNRLYVESRQRLDP